MAVKVYTTTYINIFAHGIFAPLILLMKKIISVVLACICMGTSFSQNININAGQKFFVDNKISAVTTQTIMGQSLVSNAEIATNIFIEVKDKKDSTYTLSNTYTKMKAKLSAMGNDMNFDSDKKEDMNSQYAASFKELVNQPKEVIINTSGKVLNTPKETDKNNINGDAMKMMIDQLLGDPEATGYGTEFAFVSLPSKITAGYKWTDTSNIDGIQKSTIYTVKEINGNDAIITVTGILDTDTKAQLQGMDIVNKSKGNLSGEEIVDITSGLIKQRTTTLESTGTVLITAQSLEIPMTTKITFKSTAKPT